MAKKKSKSKKAKAKKRAAQQKASQKRTAKSQKQKPEEVIEPTSSAKTFVGVVVGFVAVLIVGMLVVDGRVKTDVKPASSSNQSSGQSSLKVKPAQGQPTPTEYNLQGAQSENQDAQGGLQQQADSLQPNAGITDYENANLN